MTVIERVAVAKIDDIPEGTSRAFDVAGRRIAIFHTPGGVFATDNECPHRGGPLAEGDIVGEAIICPWHVWTFDLRTGVNDIDSSKRVQTHEVEVEDGTIYVTLRTA